MKDGKHVILCVDDDQDFLDSMKMIIEGADYIFEMAGSAQEGLQRLAETNPDLIIVDLMMEEVDAGATFVRDLKARGGDAPIFMLSSVGDALHGSTDTAQLGLAGVFQKPINPQTLLGTLKRKLG
jgi:CheY-like chemotaxis protein